MTFDLAFVDSISASASLRLALNSTGWHTLDDTVFGVPPMRRAVVSTVLSDGDQIPASAYGNRVITLALDAQHLSPDDAAAQVQKLMRELDRPYNILRYRPDTTNPVYFRTFRSDMTEVPWDAILRRATVSIVAEPFAYGEKIIVSGITINNDPNNGSNGMFFDLSSVRGDVETPVMIRLNNAAPFNTGTMSSVFAVRRRGTPSSMPLVLQCESMTLGTNTALPGNDPVMSGGGSNYAKFSPADALMAQRLSITNWPSAPSVDARGRYRVWLRCRQNTTTDVFNLQFTYGAPGIIAGNVANDTVALSGTANRRWIDLGDLAMPIFGDPVDDGGAQLPVVGLALGVSVQRVSGTGTFDMDCLLLVPADDRYCSVKWPSASGSSPPTDWMLDGVHDAVYALDAGPQVHSSNGAIARTGGLPMLYPGVTNRIVAIINACPPGVLNINDSTGDTVSVQVEYYPRYVLVRPINS